MSGGDAPWKIFLTTHFKYQGNAFLDIKIRERPDHWRGHGGMGGNAITFLRSHPLIFRETSFGYIDTSFSR